MGAWCTELIAVFVVLGVGIVTYFKYKLKYFERLNVPDISPSFPFGNVSKMVTGKLSFGEQFKAFYDHFKAKKEAHGGVYFLTQPFWIPTDITLVKRILQNDFSHFVDHGSYIDEVNDPLSGHLFNLEGTKWRNMRIKLTPTFTSGKMKLMFQTLADCTVGLRTIVDEAADAKEPIDIKEIFGRFTTDIIGSAAFGIECNSLKNPDSEFRKYGKKVFEIGVVEHIKNIIQFCLPHSILRLIKFKITQSDVEKFFLNVVQEVVEHREKNNIYRKDFMHLLLQLKNKGKITDDESISKETGEVEGDITLTMNEIAAQVFVFFLAGFETSSTTSTFALYEIASHPDIQKKMRDEINTVLAKHDGKMTYDAIMEMTYMDKVLNETLRKYPPVPMLVRRCNKAYKVPDSEVIIPEGTMVGISSLGIHNDPDYYPNPEKFDPERFSEEEKSKRPPCSWLPFGEGPRLCIGLRFGLMQTKVGLTSLLQNYELGLNSKTNFPMEMEKQSFILAVKDGVWLDVKKIK